MLQFTPEVSVGRYTRADLADTLRRDVGVLKGSSWIVHASMRSLGLVVGGPEAVVAAWLDAVGDTGRVLMPTFSDPSPGGRFDSTTTPSRTGLISETFRGTAGVRRSRHPTHSVAGWGPGVDALLDGHERVAPLGIDSPLHRAATAGAHVLMIGCDLTAASVIHVAEAIAGVPYLGRAAYPGYNRPIACRDETGRRWRYLPRQTPGDSSRFGLLSSALRDRGQLMDVRLGDASCLRFKAADALAVAAEVLRADPLAFLCHSDRCPYCTAARSAVGHARGVPAGA